MEKKTRNFIILYFIVVLPLVISAIYLLEISQAENISYSQFKSLVKQRLVTNLVVGEKQVRGEIKTESVKNLFPPEHLKEIAYDGKSNLRFMVFRVDDPALAGELEEAGIRFSGEATNPWASCDSFFGCPSRSLSRPVGLRF